MILETVLLTSLYFQCGENVHPEILHTIAITESGLNPYVIANVTDGGNYVLESEEEAIRKADELKEAGKKYSVGLMQIYSGNFSAFDLDNSTAFDFCRNISTGANILKNCYVMSKNENKSNDHIANLENAMSCYYSGNFSRGFKKDEGLNTSYVERIKNNITSIYEIPSFTEYRKFDFKKIEGLKEDPAVEGGEIVKLNLNWDVFNDYENSEK